LEIYSKLLKVVQDFYCSHVFPIAIIKAVDEDNHHSIITELFIIVKHFKQLECAVF
jgi:hypothetical protein